MDDLVLSGENFIFLLIKVGLIIFLFLYLIFAAVVIRQVKMMTETLEVGFETQIKFIVLLHFVIALVVFLMSIFVI